MSVSPSERFNSTRLQCYWPEIYSSVGRLLATLDREPHSPNFGSFDREHWGWKFRDFPIPMMQAGLLPLAQVWNVPFPNNHFYHNSRLLSWLVGVLQETCRRQHSNGAFDTVGPNTHDYGVTLAIVYFLTETFQLLQGVIGERDLDLIKETVKRGMEFSKNSSEEYAFINNHQALFALACLNAHELLGETGYLHMAEGIIDSILTHQSPDGWYEEYGGPDPGYESLGLFYLGVFWERTQSPRLFESLQKCLEFYAYCIHPDGSIGGVYGSRNTSLYFPGGFEILSKSFPLAASIARFMRENLGRSNVVTPTVSDAPNLPIFLNAYLAAAKVLDPIPEKESSSELPCESFHGLHHFQQSGITVAGTSSYYAIVNLGKGGVCRFFNRNSKTLDYEDAGYVAFRARTTWSSQHLGWGKWDIDRAGGEVACKTSFGTISNQNLTPFKFLVLRILNLTIFRSVFVGNLIKRFIVHTLIMKKKKAPLMLTRMMCFQDAQIRIQDVLEGQEDLSFEQVRIQRNFTPIHMGSAKYFYVSDLENFSGLFETDLAKDLNAGRKAEATFTVMFSPSRESRSALASFHAEG